ncbi:Helicase-like transcription factor CHR27-like protein [Drosera capensis]
MDTDYQAANPQSSDPLLEKDMFLALEGGSYAPIHFPSMEQLGRASNSVNAAQLSGLNSHDSLSPFTDEASRLPFRWTHSPLPYHRQPVMVEKMENKPTFLSKGPSMGQLQNPKTKIIFLALELIVFLILFVNQGLDTKHFLFMELSMAKETQSTIASLGSTDVKPQLYIKPHPMQVSSMDDDEDPDVCIIENTDVHARFPAWSHGRYQLSSQASTLSSEIADLPKQVAPFQSLEKSVTTFHNSSYSTAIVPVVEDRMKSKAIDECLIFQESVQDILSQDASQSHSETTPPDDLMAVPLLRHQRIALSWMVKKETGLGKTISTIALILTERGVPFKMTQSTKIVKHERLDLDEVDDKDTKENIVMDSDQKNAELCKVTSKANLLVCIYHGGSRTKDPFELAKYDVVLTTYSIVNMERPLESIKNFRTRVAQACWALCVKCRWCLSGTPLQNVVDDPYGYFRFLRYDPYTTYKAFHELVKLSISRTPTKGYQKLQAMLKTVEKLAHLDLDEG